MPNLIYLCGLNKNLVPKRWYEGRENWAKKKIHNLYSSPDVGMI